MRAVMVSEDADPPCDPDFEQLGGLGRKPEDIVLLQHSSGTTGLQKGVALSHQAVHNQLESYRQALHMDENDVIVSWLPLYHDMGLIACFLLPILLGVPLVLLSPFDWVRAPYRLMQAVTKYKGTLTWLPNFAYNFCAQKVRERDLEGVDLSTWRAVSNCSEPMRYESQHAFYETFKPYGLNQEALCTCYAMAENVFAVTQGGVDAPVTIDAIDREALQTEWEARRHIEGRPSVQMPSAGRPIPNTAGARGGFQGTRPAGAENRRAGAEERLHVERLLPSSRHHRQGIQRWLVLDRRLWLHGGRRSLRLRAEEGDHHRRRQEHLSHGPGGAGDGGEGSAPRAGERFWRLQREFRHRRCGHRGRGGDDGSAERERIADEIRQAVTRGSAVALRHVHLVGPRWLIKTSSGKNSRLQNKEKYLKEMGM